MEIEIIVPAGMVTSKSVAWGGKARDLFKASQEAIRCAMQNCAQRQKLRVWLESREKLNLYVEFHLKTQSVHHVDLDSMLSDLLNPIVEGACGPRPSGKPIPQTKDALFWRAEMKKIPSPDEKILIRIRPLEEKESEQK